MRHCGNFLGRIMRINLPTWLTLFRVGLLPVMVVVFYLPFPGHNITAAIVFVLAAFTDWLDGYLARRMNLTSAFGAPAGFAAIMVWMYWTSLTILIGAQLGRCTRDVFASVFERGRGLPTPEG